MERSLDVKMNATEDVLKSGQDKQSVPRKVACRKPELSVEKKQESVQTMNGYGRAGANTLGEEGDNAVEPKAKSRIAAKGKRVKTEEMSVGGQTP